MMPAWRRSESEKQCLQDALTHNENDIQSLRNDLDAAKGVIEKQRETKQDIRNVLTTKTARVEELAMDVENRSMENFHLKCALASKEDIIESLRDSLAAAENRSSDLEVILEDQDRLIKHQKATMASRHESTTVSKPMDQQQSESEKEHDSIDDWIVLPGN